MGSIKVEKFKIGQDVFFTTKKEDEVIQTTVKRVNKKSLTIDIDLDEFALENNKLLPEGIIKGSDSSFDLIYISRKRAKEIEKFAACESKFLGYFNHVPFEFLNREDTIGIVNIIERAEKRSKSK